MITAIRSWVLTGANLTCLTTSLNPGATVLCARTCRRACVRACVHACTSKYVTLLSSRFLAGHLPLPSLARTTIHNVRRSPDIAYWRGPVHAGHHKTNTPLCRSLVPGATPNFHKDSPGSLTLTRLGSTSMNI